MIKNSIVRISFLLALATGFQFAILYTYNKVAQSQYQEVADGSIKISSFQSELHDQIEEAIEAVGTSSLDNISRYGCADGQLLSFKNGRAICTTFQSNLNNRDDTFDKQSLKGERGEPGENGEAGSQGERGKKGDSGVLSINLGNELNGNINNQVLSLNLVTNSSTSGLDITNDGLTLLQSCSDGQVLKHVSGVWVCENDQISSVSSGNLSSITPGLTITGGTGAILGSGTAISIATATGSQNGLLSSTDWTTFNNKENALTFTGNGLFSRSDNTISAKTCANNEILVFDGSNWICGSDHNTTYTSGAGLNLSGTIFTLDPSTLTAISSVSGNDEFILQTSSGIKRITYNDLFSGVLGSLNYRGTWGADTNTPDLTSICTAGTKGHYYVVDTAGTTDLDGISSWSIGDWVVCNGSTFDRIEATNQVNSVFGRTGTVTAQSGDYGADQITNTPNGGISATTVQSAINELESEKISQALSSGNFLVGNGSNIATAVAMNGDATLSNTGALTIANDAITSTKILDGTIIFADFASNGCSNGQIMKLDGNAWTCGNDNVGTISAADLTSATAGLTITGGTGATLGSGTSISIATATGSQNGLLSSTDWTTFNNKENALTFTGNDLFSRSGDAISAKTCANNEILVFNGSNWICGSAVSAVGTLDAKTKNANGAITDANTLYLQTADDTMPGLVSTSAQTFAGTKTLANGLVINNPAASGTVLTIGAGGSANTLPIVVTSSSNQLLSFTNSDTQTIGYYSGDGSPEGVISANIGSLYTNTANGDLYTKQSGTGGTGWVKKADVYTTEYLYAYRSGSNQGPMGGNTDIILNSSQGNIPYNQSTGVASLIAGKTYHILIHTYWRDFSDTTSGFINFALVNAGTNAQISPIGQTIHFANTGPNASPGYIDFIYTPVANVNIKLRTVGNQGTAVLRYDPSTTMSIVEIH